MIEKNIFQTWKSKTSIPENFRYWSSTVRNLNSSFVRYFWDDGDNRAFIERHYPWFLDVYDGYPLEIYRVDVVRYFWLYHFGGVYIDMDSECLRPLDRLCDDHRGVVLGRMGGDPAFVHSIPNAVMMSSRRARFWLYVMHRLMMPRGALNHPEDLTGSIMLKAAVDDFCSGADDVGSAIGAITPLLGAGLQPTEVPSLPEVLPPEYFFPINWADPIHERYFRKEIIREDRRLPRDKAMALFPRSYIVTYWAHSWVYPEQGSATDAPGAGPTALPRRV